MEVKVLGSVSPFPNFNKNCPGFLVTEDETKIMLDCGNGCTSLLDPFQDLENLVVIITHLHHDHYGDLVSLANMSYVQHKLGYLKNKIKVYFPNNTLYEMVSEVGYEDFETHFLEQLYLDRIEASYLEIIPYDNNHPIKLKDKNISLETYQTYHDVSCNAVKIISDEGILVYSADTGYQEGLFQKFAKNADLFICESSFLKEQEQYNSGYHLCSYQAALYAKELKVKELMLTHFYPTIDKSLYLQEAKEIFENTIVAEEGMVKKIGERK